MRVRVIGTPQWNNVSRSYDQGRMYYRLPKARFEVLMVSPVKLLPGDFNVPDLGERIWGTYNVFTHIWHGASVERLCIASLPEQDWRLDWRRHLGNRQFRRTSLRPLPAGLAYSFEGIGQTGQVGLLTQRAYAWFAGVSQKTTVFGRALTSSPEYKVASGTKLGSTTSGTYDQLAPSNHDKFGQLDLFGWRNLKTFKMLESLGVTKALAFNEMYSNDWLFSAADSLYNSTGSSIALSKKGTAGTHVGQELDSFMTYKWGAHTFGAGVGYFFDGQFVENATLHINPRYMYIFQQYNFK